MTTANSFTINSNEILLLWKKPVTENIRLVFPVFFMHLVYLANHIFKSIFKADTIQIIIPKSELEEFLRQTICGLSQVRLIFVICENKDDLQACQTQYKNYSKLHFYLFSTFLLL